MRYEEYVKGALEKFTEQSLIPAEDFPALALYADQVAGFLNEKLKVYADDGGPVITKTMIANYVKHDMLPSPVRKRYTRDHMVLIAMIFYLKSTFQMSEIEQLMKPFIDNHASTFDDKIDFQKLYGAIRPVLREGRDQFADEIQKDIERIKDSIWETGLEDDDTTEFFSLMLCLAARVDAAKYMAQDLMRACFSGADKSKKANKSVA